MSFFIKRIEQQASKASLAIESNGSDKGSTSKPQEISSKGAPQASGSLTICSGEESLSDSSQADLQDESMRNSLSPSSIRRKSTETNETAYQVHDAISHILATDLLPQPQPILPGVNKVVRDSTVYTGLRICLKKAHKFSADPDSGGGALAPFEEKTREEKDALKQAGVRASSHIQRVNLSDFVCSQIDQTVFCRYGLEHLRLNFKNPEKTQPTEVGSFKIDIDALVFTKQRHIQQEKGNFLTHFKRQNAKTATGDDNDNKIIQPYYAEPQQNILAFDSVFESGNLAVAQQSSATSYNLVLQNDINTQGHTQWYYFKVVARFDEDTLPAQRTIRFDILNLQKRESLYNQGMRVLVLDCNEQETDQEERLPKWVRGGSSITYQMNHYLSSCGNLFSLSFTYEFPPGQNTFYFAHSVPYTYSMLCDYMEAKARRKFYLCQSLAGNRVEYLHLKSNPSSPHAKNVIFISSRVHPGESQASWIMHGLLQCLLDPQSDEEKLLVQNLKDHFDFYLVPMLNPDGVINGNYRCSLAAVDLNRRFGQSTSKVFHPTVHATKHLLHEIAQVEKKPFFMYLDIHGHSIEKNVFQYGNQLHSLVKTPKKANNPKLFPMLMSQQLDYFSYQGCSFSMPLAKQDTARVALFHQLRIPFVFTLEASFCGPSIGTFKDQHFSLGHFMDIGKAVLKACWAYKLQETKGGKQAISAITAQAESEYVNVEGKEECDSSSDNSPPSPKKETEKKERKPPTISQNYERPYRVHSPKKSKSQFYPGNSSTQKGNQQIQSQNRSITKQDICPLPIPMDKITQPAGEHVSPSKLQRRADRRANNLAIVRDLKQVDQRAIIEARGNSAMMNYNTSANQLQEIRPQSGKPATSAMRNRALVKPLTTDPQKHCVPKLMKLQLPDDKSPTKVNRAQIEHIQNFIDGEPNISVKNSRARKFNPQKALELENSTNKPLKTSSALPGENPYFHSQISSQNKLKKNKAPAALTEDMPKLPKHAFKSLSHTPATNDEHHSVRGQQHSDLNLDKKNQGPLMFNQQVLAFIEQNTRPLTQANGGALDRSPHTTPKIDFHAPQSTDTFSSACPQKAYNSTKMQHKQIDCSAASKKQPNLPLQGNFFQSRASSGLKVPHQGVSKKQQNLFQILKQDAPYPEQSFNPVYASQNEYILSLRKTTPVIQNDRGVRKHQNKSFPNQSSGAPQSPTKRKQKSSMDKQISQNCYQGQKIVGSSMSKMNPLGIQQQGSQPPTVTKQLAKSTCPLGQLLNQLSGDAPRDSPLKKSITNSNVNR